MSMHYTFKDLGALNRVRLGMAEAYGCPGEENGNY